VIKELFSSTKLFLPSTKSEAEDQLRILIKFIDLIARKKSIASAGYRFGLRQPKKTKEGNYRRPSPRTEPS
jgi:hypothetical protein